MLGYFLFFLMILCALAAPTISIVGLCLRSKPVGVKLYTYSSFFSCIEIAGLLSSPISSLLQDDFPKFVALVLTIVLFFLSYKLCQNLWPSDFPSKQKERNVEAIRGRILDILAILDATYFPFPYYDVKPYVLSCFDEYEGKYNGSKHHTYSQQNGRVYSASPSDPLLFVFVCMGNCAQLYENDKLRVFCDEHILDASRAKMRSI